MENVDSQYEQLAHVVVAGATEKPCQIPTT